MTQFVFTGDSVNKGVNNIQPLYSNLDWSGAVTNTRIEWTGEIRTSTLNLNGSVYEVELLFTTSANPFAPRGPFLNTVTYSFNGLVTAKYSQLSVSKADYDFYRGENLSRVLFQGNDRIAGSEYDDVLNGFDGDDSIYGYGGNDTIIGGNGNDYLYGGDGNDVLRDGGSGIKSYFGGDGIDVVQLRFGPRDYGLSTNPITGDVLVSETSGNLVGIISSDVEIVRFQNESEIETKNLLYTGKYSSPSDATSAVFRFYNNENGSFFYTNDPGESQFIQDRSSATNSQSSWPYVFQGATFESAHTYDSPSKVKIHRFFHTENGYHFYSIDPDEIEHVKKMSESGEWKFNYEGTGFWVYKSDPVANARDEEIEVYRFYNPQQGRHFYTADVEEKELIQATGVWTYEGVAFYGEII